MFYITKKMELSAAHSLNLKETSKCSKLHGHNWKVKVTIGAPRLNDEGMVIDFSRIKETVMKLDHENLNAFIVQPTAEKLAEYLNYWLTKLLLDECRNEAFVKCIIVEESNGNVCRLVCGD